MSDPNLVVPAITGGCVVAAAILTGFGASYVANKREVGNMTKRHEWEVEHLEQRRKWELEDARRRLKNERQSRRREEVRTAFIEYTVRRQEILTSTSSGDVARFKQVEPSFTASWTNLLMQLRTDGERQVVADDVSAVREWMRSRVTTRLADQDSLSGPAPDGGEIIKLGEYMLKDIEENF